MQYIIEAKSQDNINFYLSNDPEASSLYKSFAEEDKSLREDQSKVNIKMITLDNIFSQFNLNKIDLLKIDVEGGEWDLLDNFSKDDFKRINQISVEFHDFKNPSLTRRTEECIKKLQGYGYLFVHRGVSIRYGSPYKNCLFYKGKRLRWTKCLNWFVIKNSRGAYAHG